MRKAILMTLSLTLISLFLFGCQSKENTPSEPPVNTSTESENNHKLLIDSDLKSVSVSKTNGSDELTFDEKDSIRAFQSIFSSAVKEGGIVNMAKPEFYLEVVYAKESRQSLYLWIGEKGQKSVFMKVGDTHTIYTVSEDKTDKLIELVESRF